MRLNSCKVGLIILCMLSLVSEMNAQSAPPLAPGYYIVVAAYKQGQDDYARRYINAISASEDGAKYGLDAGRKFIYVYLDYFTDFDKSINEMLATRKKAGFEQAWVRIMKGEMQSPAPLVVSESKEPDTKKTETQVQEAPAKVEQVEPTPAEQAVRTEEEEIRTDPVEVVIEEITTTEEAVTEPKPMSDASVYFSLFNARTNEPIPGEVEIVDVERARLITKMKGNELNSLPDPKSKSGQLTLLANVFGYRPLQHNVNYLQIAADSMSHYVEWAGNHYVIKFDLARYHKGDIQTLYNVYFFNDAAVMLPESRYQLNSLLDMMNENPGYRIMLHGHTNGNARGKLITMGPSKNFFALADDVKEGTGTAKELSKERALAIKEWLVSEGIDEGRIEIKAWGGGRMLHDKNSVNAKRNVRVDVEILEE